MICDLFLGKNENLKKEIVIFQYLKNYFLKKIKYMIFKFAKKTRCLNLMKRLFKKTNFSVKKTNFLITYKITSFPLSNPRFDIIFNYFINLLKKKKIEFFKKIFFLFYQNKKSFIKNQKLINTLFQNLKSIISKDSILIFTIINKNFDRKNMEKFIKKFVVSIRMIFSGFSYQYKIKILKIFFSFLKFYLKGPFLFAFIFFQRFIWKMYRIFSIKLFIIKTKMDRSYFFFNNSISGLKLINNVKISRISKLFKYQEKILNNHHMIFPRNIYNFLLYFIIYIKIKIKSFERKKYLFLRHHRYNLISKSEIFLLHIMNFIRPKSRFFLENMILKYFFLKSKNFKLKNKYFHLSKNLKKLLKFFHCNLKNFYKFFLIRVIFTILSNKIELLNKDTQKFWLFLEPDMEIISLNTSINYRSKPDIIFFIKNKLSFKKHNSLFKIFLAKYLLLSIVNFFFSIKKNFNLIFQNFFLFIHFFLFSSTKNIIFSLLKIFLFFPTHHTIKINNYYYYLTKLFEN